MFRISPFSPSSPKGFGQTHAGPTFVPFSLHARHKLPNRVRSIMDLAAFQWEPAIFSKRQNKTNKRTHTTPFLGAPLLFLPFVSVSVCPCHLFLYFPPEVSLYKSLDGAHACDKKQTTQTRNVDGQITQSVSLSPSRWNGPEFPRKVPPFGPAV